MTTSETPQKKKKKRKFSAWWLVLILAVLGVGFFFGRQAINRKQAEAAINQLETTPYKRDILATTINGSGTVRAKQSAVLMWQASGYVGELHVALGDAVKTNQVLLSLDKTRLPAEMLQAEVNMLNAESAMENLESDTALQRAKLQQDITSVESNLRTLEDQKTALSLRSCSQDRIDSLQKSYDQALENYENYPSQARWLLVENARQNLAFCDPKTIEDDLNALESQIVLLNQTLSKHQNDLNKIRDGVDAEVENKLQLQLELAKKQVDSQFVRSPFDGTVSALNNQLGDTVSPGTIAVTISDLSELFLEVAVSEVDIPAIQVGQPAELIFDAFFEESYQGEVTQIASVPTTTSGVVNYIVTIAMKNGIDKVKPGMTAGVNILTETKENVYVVPAESVFSREGKTYVYVRRDGRPVMVAVRIGAYSNRLVEILQGDIKDGEPVYLSPPVNMIENFMNMGRPRGR